MVVEKQIIGLLESAGYEAYMVGGCVRDDLLGVDSNDIDLVTNASTDEMLALFSGKFRSIDEVGKNFGVLLVEGIEIAQYRTEVYNVVGKPEVALAGTMELDSARRDFTVNAMYEDIRGNVLDPQGGRADIEARVIRAVGEPLERFQEDPSRMLRAVYLSAKLGFTIEEKTFTALRLHGDLVQAVPVELRGKLVKKALLSGNFVGFMRGLAETELLGEVMPELAHLVGLYQNPKFHKFDAWEHTMAVLETAERVRPGDIGFMLGALYHDNAKGLDGVRTISEKSGEPTDRLHEEVGAEIAERALMALGFGKAIATRAKFFVAMHGIRLEIGCRDRSIVKWLRKIASWFANKEEMTVGVEDVLDFVLCDASGFNESLRGEVEGMVNGLRDRIMTVLSETMFYVSELPVSGRDAVEVGLKGVVVGESLGRLVEMNVRDAERARQLLSNWSKK